MQQGQALTPNVDASPANGLDNSWYEIDGVTNCRMIAGKPHFLVWWNVGTRSYEPDSNISDFAKVEYYARCQARRKPKRRTQ